MPKPMAREVIAPHRDPIPAKTPIAQRKVIPPKPTHTATVETKKKPNSTPVAQQQNIHQYWKRAEENFNRQWDKLDVEQDPAKRNQLIRNMAQYVRMDTLSAIEWALSLADPEERRLALESINKYALTGIGARIGMDQTGFPAIRETTALSAVASTGLVEPGDYIVGMQDEYGQFVDFKGLSMQQIIQHLRGEAGTDVLLYMERLLPQDGDAKTFEVPVKRSLLVIQPPK